MTVDSVGYEYHTRMGADEGMPHSQATLAQLEGHADFKPQDPAVNCWRAMAARGVACCATIVHVSVTIITIKPLLSAVCRDPLGVIAG